MKNVIKKMFSLLLVGVVAVSMFGFVAPNRVDAAETDALEGSVLVKTTCSENAYIISSTVEFLTDSGKTIKIPMRKHLDGRKSECVEYKIPKDARTVKVNVMNCKGIKPLNFLSKTFVFKRDKYKPAFGNSIIVSASFPLPKSFPHYEVSYASNWDHDGTFDQYITY